MSIAVWFWVIFVIALLFNLWTLWPLGRANSGVLVFFILFALLAWQVFGSPIHR